MKVWSLAMASDWSIGSNWSPHWSRMTRALLPTPALRGARWLAARGTTGRTAWGPGLIRSTVKAPLEATMQVSEWVIPGFRTPVSIILSRCQGLLEFGLLTLDCWCLDYWRLDYCCLDYCCLDFCCLDYCHLDYCFLDYCCLGYFPSGTFNNLQEPLWPFRTLQEPLGTFRNLQELWGTIRNRQKPLKSQKHKKTFFPWITHSLTCMVLSRTFRDHQDPSGIFRNHKAPSETF